MARTNSSVLWHWTGTKAPELPAWVTPEMYSGRYTSPINLDTAVVATNVNANRSGKITNGFLKALLRARMIRRGASVDGFGKNSNVSIAEMTMSTNYSGTDVGLGEVVCVVYNHSTGEIKASKSGMAYKVATESSAPIFLAMIPFLLEDQIFSQKFDIFCKVDESDQFGIDSLRACACFLADYVYAATSGTPTSGINVNQLPICSPSQVRSLTQTAMGTPMVKPTSYEGHFQKFPVTNISHAGNNTVSKQKVEVKDFVGSYIFSTNKLTPEQEKLVPKLDAGYVIHDTLITCCQHIKATTGRPRPVRNILLRGEPGTGKSETYVGIAAGCHLPLYTFAANAMTEPFDLFGQFVPIDENGEQTGPKVPLDKIISGLPSAKDMSMDPVFAYQEITGLYKEDATATDCMTAAFNLAQKSIDVSGGQQRFKFVPGQLIYAMKNGGVWGFDEVTLPQNPGVVPALNPAMDNTQSITLPTGEIINRHPDCIFVGTTNIDLEGCRRMNQAWQDRCQLIIDMEEPSDDELIARVKSMTGFDDSKDAAIVDLDKFVRAYHEFKQIAKRKRLDDGTIGPRKLADWVTSTLVTGDPVASARITIIPGATADEQGISELCEKLGDIF